MTLEVMAIGWNELGNLAKYSTLQDRLNGHTIHAEPRNDSRTTFNFPNEVKAGDRVFVRRGVHEVVGYGIVDGPYKFQDERSSFKHLHKMKWLARVEWRSPIRLPLITVSEITDRPEDVETLLRLVGLDEEKSIPPVEPDQRAPFSIDESMEGLFVSGELFEKTLAIWRAKKKPDHPRGARSWENVHSEETCLCAHGLQGPEPDRPGAIPSFLQL